MKGIFEKKEHFGLIGRSFRGFRGWTPMFHTHGEIILLTKGSLSMVVDGKPLILQAGELSVLFPYLVHSYEQSPEAEGLLILFDPSESAFDNLFLTKKPLSPIANAETFRPLLERLMHWVERGRIKTAFGYLNAIIGEFLEISPLEDSLASVENTAVRILEYCTEHFTEEITVKSVAEALYVSQSYISKVFSEKLKYGFREYINSLRIQKAKSLLKHSDKRIVDIMLDCGFQNQSSFNRVFREACGLSPREYQNKERANEKA